MNLTEEQQIIIDHVLHDTENLIKVDSCAGSGKTSLLVELVKQLKPESGLYLAYNKAIALESKKKFPKEIECVTVHSLAYKNTIGNSELNLHLGNFFWKSITEKISYEMKVTVVELMKEWALSQFVTFDTFQNYKQIQSVNLNNYVFDLVKKYFNQMISGIIPISHDAYLKLYHLLLLHNKTTNNLYDLIMLDECGDLNMVTLEIFRLLSASKKIMVGDLSQNIYTFNHTVNGFEVMKDEGIQLSMSQSFRCDHSIAKQIEKFGHKYIDKNKHFKGVIHQNKDIKTIGYISRNNAELVKKMVELYELDIKFNTLRPIDSIFELILILLQINNEEYKIKSTEYKFLQSDMNDFLYDIGLQMLHQTPYQYIANLYKDDIQFKSAFVLISKHGDKIFDIYNQLKSQEKSKKKYNITLGTVFGTKGLEFDSVHILDDLNKTIEKVLDANANFERTIEAKQNDLVEFNLYYTACSRAKYELHNARMLKEFQV